jgi:hypothetical protein
VPREYARDRRGEGGKDGGIRGGGGCVSGASAIIYFGGVEMVSGADRRLGFRV